jgi:hypothetical protein
VSGPSFDTEAKMRAVVLALADHTHRLRDATDDDEALAVALEAALDLPPESDWDYIERRLRALAGGDS